jgi:hypothetical protein
MDLYRQVEIKSLAGVLGCGGGWRSSLLDRREVGRDISPHRCRWGAESAFLNFNGGAP